MSSSYMYSVSRGKKIYSFYKQEGGVETENKNRNRKVDWDRWFQDPWAASEHPVPQVTYVDRS